MTQLLDSHLHASGAPDELRHLIVYLARAAKYISYALKTGDMGLAGGQNASGDHQLKIDVLANKIIMETLEASHLVQMAASEEEEAPRTFAAPLRGDFLVAFDPLDGSSLVDTNLAIGSIFSIYRGPTFIGKTGRDQVAAATVIYGPRTTLIYSVGKGVHEFTLNDVGEFTLTRGNIRLAEKAKHFAPGNLRAATVDPAYRAQLNRWIDGGYTLRYSGCMVADMNHLFLKGEGIFTYPPFPPKYPTGKLRLLFECAPFAWLAEQAGGAATDGQKPILEIKVANVHQTTPIVIGSAGEVKILTQKN